MDLTTRIVTDISTVCEILREGNERRAMASTSHNTFSTRSHAILQVTITRRTENANEQTESKLSMIDLAGSERAASSENRGMRMIEGAKINRSLLSLGNCINILSDPRKVGHHIPYRDSKLTRLLKESLGGNTRTIMLACISPAMRAIEETINTIKYAKRASAIQQKVTRNTSEVQGQDYQNIIENLQAEITGLKAQLGQRSESPFTLRGEEDSLEDEESI